MSYTDTKVCWSHVQRGQLAVREIVASNRFHYRVGPMQWRILEQTLTNCKHRNRTKIVDYTGLFKMTVGILTTCHTQYTSFSRCNPMWFLPMRLRQASGLCSSSSRKYSGTEGCYMVQTVLKELDYRVDVCRITKGAHRAPVRYVTKTWECCSIK